MNRIELKPQYLIASGSTRSCYRHPDNPDRCIKIDLMQVPGVTSHKEVKYFEKLLRIRPNFDYLSIAKCYGWRETTMGAGTEHDLIRNETDGQCSQTLYEYLRKPQDSESLTKIKVAFDEFVTQLNQHCIPIRDLNHKNLCIKELANGEFRFVVVDGVGHTHLIPIIDHWRWFARRKIQCYLERFDLSPCIFSAAG